SSTRPIPTGTRKIQGASKQDAPPCTPAVLWIPQRTSGTSHSNNFLSCPLPGSSPCGSRPGTEDTICRPGICRPACPPPRKKDVSYSRPLPPQSSAVSQSPY